jgi:5'-3' exoribonuclease 1
MGIPSYFKRVIEKYPSIATVAGDLDIDFFFMDFNGVVYDCVPLLNKRLEYKDSIKKKYEKELIIEIINYLQKLVCTIVRPSKLLYLGMDGPPPRAKMTQQRWRRFKKTLEDRLDEEARAIYKVDKKEAWPSNHNTSPGTEFMSELSKALQDAIKKGIFNKHSKKMKIVLSDASVPGEGEHKIIPYMRKIKAPESSKYVIYSKDADLMVLSLVSKKDNIYIIRSPEAQILGNKLKAKFTDVDLIYVSMNEFRDRFIDDLDLKGFDHKRILIDYTVLTFLLGNDFVPPLPGMLIKEQGLDRLIKIYSDLMIKGEKDRYLIEKNGDLNMYIFKSILEELGKSEWYNLKNLQERYQTQKFRYRDADVDSSEFKKYEERKLKATIYMEENPQRKKYEHLLNLIDYFQPKEVWKNAYYKHFVGIDEKKDPKEYNTVRQMMGKEYLKAIVFIAKYYTEGVPSWTWTYPYRVAPFISDLQRSVHGIKNANAYFKFEKGKPFAPLEQLLMILPPQASHLLPAKLATVMTDIKSPVIDLYPTEFELDFLQGKTMMYSEPILPYQDSKRILEVSGPIIKTLDKKDKERNKLGKDLRF